jgi:hypothetical protein
MDDVSLWAKDIEMNKYKKADFGHMKYNPFGGDFVLERRAAKKGDFGGEYAGLFTMESWIRDGLVMDVREGKVVSYIFMMYQVGSPLLAIQNLVARKVEAADLAGFERVGTEYGEGYKRILAGEDDFWNRRVIDFCRVQNSPDFAEYVVYEEIFYRQLELAKGNTDATQVKNMLANVQGVKAKMKELQKSLMFGDDTRGLIKSFLEEVSFEGMNLRRDDIAHALKEGTDPLDGYNAYGEGYEVVFAKDVNKERYQAMRGEVDIEALEKELEGEDV